MFSISLILLTFKTWTFIVFAIMTELRGIFFVFVTKHQLVTNYKPLFTLLSIAVKVLVVRLMLTGYRNISSL